MPVKRKVIIILLFLTFFLIFISENTQQEINWYPSFSIKHKIPFGSFIAHTEISKLLSDSLIDVPYSPYVYLKKNTIKGTYLIYNEEVNLSDASIDILLNWVKKGNNLFISSTTFKKKILDILQLKTKLYVNTNFENIFYFKLLPSKFSKEIAKIDKLFKINYFKKVNITNENNVSILGKIIDEKQNNLYNFISVKYGKGRVYLHTVPYIFTNYFILKSDNNLKYFENVFSYINQKKIIYWDINAQNASNVSSIFKYIISNPAFLWAYRLLFIGLFIYLLFEGKRKQRAIPVIAFPRNETIDFTKTIADIYTTNKEDKQIALLHIKHFMNYLRTKLHIDTRMLNDEILNRIAQRTKTNIKEIKDLFALINYIKQTKKIKSDTVLKLEKMIEKIKNNNM